MSDIVISGVPPYDGRWPFDVDLEFTTREWGWVKRLSGYLPLTIDEGLSDPELLLVFAVIALRRAGKIEPGDAADAFEKMSDAPFGTTVRLDLQPKDDDDAGPPVPSSTANADTFGDGSPMRSAPSTTRQNDSGTPGSATSESRLAELLT